MNISPVSANTASFFNSTIELGPFDHTHVKRELTRQLIMCQMRGLNETCKWLSDLLVALPGSDQEVSPTDFAEYYQDIGTGFAQYSMAKSFLDTKEYDRCAHVLSGDSKSSLLYFLRMFAKYMSAEKKWIEDEMDLRPNDMNTQRSEMIWIKRDFESQMRKSELVDAFCIYLYGVVLKRLGLKDMAIEAFCNSVTKDNALWCAWYELSTLMESREKVTLLKVPNCFMKFFFEAKVYMELHENERALDVLMKLSEAGFVKSSNVKTDLAITYNAMRDMDMAAKQFEAVRECDPYRLDGMDVYSNVLFVRENLEELAHLTQHCVHVDKYKPQTCCIIGNLYSRRGEHSKAVMYFQRALKLRPSYSLVWTLVGHEYVELHNINAAVHAYRNAIMHNRRDYRAWYGLGQLYEMLKLPSFTLYYYREALCLQPGDSRIMVALGETYERMQRLEEAKKCFWRAYSVGDVEGNALIRLGKCYERCDEMDEAAAAYTEFIKLCERKGILNEEDLAQAYKFLANYHLRMGHHEDASVAAHKCLDFAETKEEGKAMLKQINALRGQLDVEGATSSGDVSCRFNVADANTLPISRTAPFSLVDADSTANNKSMTLSVSMSDAEESDDANL